MPTIKDIAASAKVSMMTVSRFFNTPEKVSEKTKQKIIKTMEEMDYHPNQVARSLVTKRTNIIGVIIPDIKNPFFSSCLHSIEEYADKLGFGILICNSEEDAAEEMKYLELLLARRVDGIILMPVSRESVSLLKKYKKPFILVDRKFDDIETDYITADHYYGAHNAVEHLISLGHKKIGIVKGPDHLFPFSERYKGYCDALNKHNIKIEAKYIKDGELVDTVAYNRTRELLERKDRPTALFTCNNLMTVGAVEAIFDLNLNIPDDISLFSFDSLPFHNIIRPRISCTSQPVEFIGTNAAMILIGKINETGYKEIQKVTLKPEIIYGESCASPKI